MHYSMFSSIPGLYQLVTHSIQLCWPSISPDIAKCPLGNKNHPQLRTTGVKIFPEEEEETDTQVNSDGYKEREREAKAEIWPGFLGGDGKRALSLTEHI